MSEPQRSPKLSLKAKEAARQRRMRRIVFGIGGGLLASLLLAVFLLMPLFRPASETHRAIAVRVPSGASVARIGEILQEKGVIRSAFAFGLYARWNHVGDKFKAGRYTLSSDMTLSQISYALENGGAGQGDDRIRVTIPEGYTLRQIADTLDEAGVCDGKLFLKVATDPNVIAHLHADFPLPANTLEGYLFPDTYPIAPNTPPVQILEAMIMNFYTRFVRPYQSEIGASGRSLHEIVTLASLIEREARVPSDRARIAGVLDNRLQRGIKLEVDATVLYALGHHKDRVLYKDLAVDSPYNTYRHEGLPPGPIANPGLASLLAALRPEKNGYLFYVARPNGAHIFTSTLAEHEAAKRQARLEWQRQGNGTEAHTGG